MDEFKPEDELKPDASDRRPSRPRKTSSAPKVPVSRQHLMMGIGILVLLLLVFGIGSALNGPDKSASGNKPATGAAPAATNTSAGGGEKSIDLSGSSSMSNQNGNAPTPEQSTSTATASGNSPQNGKPEELNVPPVSSTPTEAKPQSVPEGQRRVELPGDLNTALNNQQNQVNSATEGAQGGGSGLPTAPATIAPGSAHPSASTKIPAANHTAAASKPAVSTPKHEATHSAPVAAAKSSSSAPAKSASASASHSSTPAGSHAMPSGSYTLQLSGASREESLNSWAKKQNLSSYHVYKTTRNGQPWYVLVSGSYATPADAKRAVASLPAEVRAQNPWVKPLSQVKKEAN